jgi:hypothetical protein
VRSIDACGVDAAFTAAFSWSVELIRMVRSLSAARADWLREFFTQLFRQRPIRRPMRTHLYLRTAFLLADLVVFFIRTPEALALLAPLSLAVRIPHWLLRARVSQSKPSS